MGDMHRTIHIRRPQSNLTLCRKSAKNRNSITLNPNQSPPPISRSCSLCAQSALPHPTTHNPESSRLPD